MVGQKVVNLVVKMAVAKVAVKADQMAELKVDRKVKKSGE